MSTLLTPAYQFESRLDKYIRAMSSFRDDVRKLAIAGGSSKDMLALCDKFRDDDLVNLGVQLDDGQGAGEYKTNYWSSQQCFINVFERSWS